MNFLLGKVLMIFDTCSTLGRKLSRSLRSCLLKKEEGKLFSYMVYQEKLFLNSPLSRFVYSKIFCVKFLFSSSFAVLKRCGAFRMTSRTFFTPWWSDLRPLPVDDSAIVGNAELLLRLNDPKRSERDNERDSGRRRCKVEACDELGDDDDDSVAFLSNNVVSILSSSAMSVSLLEARFAVVELADANNEWGSISESCNNKEWNSFPPLIIVVEQFKRINPEWIGNSM